MSGLWKWIDVKEISKEEKIRVFLFLNCLIHGVLGLLVWLVVSRFMLNTLGWAFCFIGYPGFFIGFVGGFLYLCRQ